MLYLIGIGLIAEHLTLEAINAVKNCDQVFLEAYTSKYSFGSVEELEKNLGKKVVLLDRKAVEENFHSALLSANKNNIALLIFGNPLTATTHIQILLDAKENGIKYKVIPGISITNYIAESGLDEYKFGRTVTVCYHSKDFEPDSFYTQLVENKKIGLHTLCLLDIKRDEKPERLMNCVEGIEVLEKIATNKKNTKTKNQKIPKEKMDFVGLIAMGSNKQKIIVGKKAIFESPEVKTFFPQALVVCGKLNPKEKEALEKLN